MILIFNLIIVLLYYIVNMPSSCCVPGCTRPKKVHSLPFTSGLKWKRWLQACPFLRKYSYRKLENLRICRKHFKPEYIDNVKGRLTMDAVPSLYLSPIKPNMKADKDKKLLEVSPIHPNMPVCVKVVSSDSLPAQTENTFKCPSIQSIVNEKRQATYLVCLKAGDPCGLPVDHNMYCLPPLAHERSACLFSPCVMCQTPTKELLSSDRTILSIEDGQPLSAPVDHNMYCRTPLSDASAGCLPAEPVQQTAKPLSPNVECNMKTEPVTKEELGIVDTQLRSFMVGQGMPEATFSRRTSVASQTEDSQKVAIQHQKQLTHRLSVDIEQPLKEQQGTEAVELLLDSECVQNNNSIQDNMCVLPSATVAEDSAHKGSYEQSIYLSPNIFNLLTSKSPLEKETRESIQSLFTALKEKHSMPFNHVLTESSKSHRFTDNNSSELNTEHSMMKPTTSVSQPLQGKPAQKLTLESLVAELTESVSAEEMSELQSAPAEMEADTADYLTNATSDAEPCSPMQESPVIALDPSYTEIRRVRLHKEYSSNNERLLRMQNNMLKKKLRNLNCRYKKLKSKSDTIFAKSKEFIKNYPHLSPGGKLIVDLQIRLARQHPKGFRYSEEEKMFALKLLQLFPEGYKFLQPLLKLPAKTTMCDFMKLA